MALNNGAISNYGFGWDLIPNAPNGKIVWHNGDNPGYKTLIMRFVDQKRTLIILCNNATAEFVNLTNTLRTAVAGEADAKKYKDEYTRLAEILKSKINSTIDNVSYSKKER